MWEYQDLKEQSCYLVSDEDGLPYFNPLKRMLTALHWVELPSLIVLSGRHPDGLPPQPPRLLIEAAIAAPQPVAAAVAVLPPAAEAVAALPLAAAPPPVAAAVAAAHRNNEHEVQLIGNFVACMAF